MIPEQYKERYAKLNEIRAELKECFVGLDDVIDNIIKAISTWYVCPEILNRPTIVNLWGMTGVGKTSLVRKLVDLLGMHNLYVEIPVNIRNDGKQELTIEEKFCDNDIYSDITSILLLDDFQNFHTLDSYHNEVQNNAYRDIWNLLSDGIIGNPFMWFFRMQYHYHNAVGWRDNKSKDNEDVYIFRYDSSEFAAIRIAHQILEIPMDTIIVDDDFVQIKLKDLIQLYKDASVKLRHKENKQQVYSKLLIFISGNLDNVFTMSNRVSNVNIDADTLYEHTKQVSVLDIKDGLSTMFKPEQVARLGNTHIIYHSLSKNDFINVIKKDIAKKQIKVKELCGFDMVIDNSVYELLYRNGVYPTQGVRPVLNTISNLFDTVIPSIMSNLVADTTGDIYLTAKDSKLEVTFPNNECVSFEVKAEIDSLNKEIDINTLHRVAVHEAGHALVYMNLYKSVPQQICIKSINSSNTGFVVNSNKQSLLLVDNALNNIAVSLSGEVAENLVFGKNLVSLGNVSDMRHATELASDLVRTTGYYSKFYGKYAVNDNDTLTNIKDTDGEIQRILLEQRRIAEKILKNNEDTLKKLVMFLIDNQDVNNEKIYNFIKSYILDISLEYKSLDTAQDRVKTWLGKSV